MAEVTDQILYEIRELKSWLYGREGHEGDVPEIKAGLKNHSKRIRRIEIIIAGLLVTGGGLAGLIKLLGWYMGDGKDILIAELKEEIAKLKERIKSLEAMLESLS